MTGPAYYPMPWHTTHQHEPGCDCRLCVLAGRLGPPDCPTAANPAKVPAPEPVRVERTLFDGGE